MCRLTRFINTCLSSDKDVSPCSLATGRGNKGNLVGRISSPFPLGNESTIKTLTREHDVTNDL